MSQTELAFMTNPVAGDSIPGIPTPTDVAGPMVSSSRSTSPAMAVSVL